MRLLLISFLLVACGSPDPTEPQEPDWEPPPPTIVDAAPPPDDKLPVGSSKCAPAYCFMLNGELHCLPKLCEPPDFNPPSPKGAER